MKTGTQLPDVDLHGKVILLTGANSGIGKVTALELAKMGASLVLVCRNKEKGKEAVDEFVKKSGNSSIELIIADLLPQREVRRVASEFVASHSRLDVLINNAGTNFPSFGVTEDGIEQTMAVNYFTPFLLTNLLLGVLEKSTPSRVVNVASVGHFGGDLLLDNLTQDRRMGAQGFSAYQRSKLALVLFTYELARRLDGKQVTANCLHPGTIRTNIWAHAGVASPLTRFASLFMKSAEEGARTSVYLASSPDVERVSGKYFDNRTPKRASEKTYDQSIALRLWEQSIIMTGLDEPVTRN
ncbi:MAG: SDR family oxidoreductase [Nitrososphaerota archaeon]|nr:SDR family oxidoreductase [Nitrososphaerota archaeon]